MWKKILAVTAIVGAIVIIWTYRKRKKRLYGCLLADMNYQETVAKMSETELYMCRKPVYFHNDYKSDLVDNILRDGFKVQINFNWKPTGTPVVFPTDKQMIRRQAERFFEHYFRWKDQIPLIVCENEWDNDHYRDWENTSIEDYIEELKIVVEIGHEYGFKVTDAGLTGNNLGRWTWSQLRGEMKIWWQQRYFIGQDNDYWKMVALITKYAKLIRDVPIDYINTHWYNKEECHFGYPVAIMLYKRIIGKQNLPLVNNEWGIKTKDKTLFDNTKLEIEKAGAQILIAYSGIDEPDKAVQLTDEMLQELH